MNSACISDSCQHVSETGSAEDLSTIFGSAEQFYVPSASLKGTTAVSPFTTPRFVAGSLIQCAKLACMRYRCSDSVAASRGAAACAALFPVAMLLIHFSFLPALLLLRPLSGHRLPRVDGRLGAGYSHNRVPACRK